MSIENLAVPLFTPNIAAIRASGDLGTCMAFICERAAGAKPRIREVYFKVLSVNINHETGAVEAYSVQSPEDMRIGVGIGAGGEDVKNIKVEQRKTVVRVEDSNTKFVPVGSVMVKTPTGLVVMTPGLEYFEEPAETGNDINYGFREKKVEAKVEVPVAEKAPAKK